MAKKLTLEQTWTLCLQMWKWIAGQIRKDPDISVWRLKAKWLSKHDWGVSMYCDCFFCDWAGGNRGFPSCPRCPARKIDKDFDCEDTDYDYSLNPIEFYKKLVALNKKRKARKPNAKDCNAKNKPKQLV